MWSLLAPSLPTDNATARMRGGEPPPVAAGAARVLEGLREAPDDDRLLQAAAGVSEGRHRPFFEKAAA